MLDIEVDLKKFADYFERGSIDITEFEAFMDVCKHYRNFIFFQNSYVKFIRQQAIKSLVT